MRCASALPVFIPVLIVKVLVLPVRPVSAQETVRLRESFAPGHQYQVHCRVDIKGTLSLTSKKDAKTPASLSVSGSSAIDYDERILTPHRDGERSLRVYRRMDFQRKVGPEAQATSLRPEVARLVILRRDQFEVPFSPDGPLLWNEIELVRTDVYTPALAGLLPANEVKPGERWEAAASAARELTDLHRIESGRLVCVFETVTTLAGRRLARVGLSGTLQGPGEDGPARHDIEGYFLFDLEAAHLSYLSVKGSHSLLTKEGAAGGKIEGTFVLTRQPLAAVKELSDDALRGLALEPNEENTLLLQELPELGVRFLHARRWRVASIKDNQIALDEPKGSGMLITIEPRSATPSGAAFLQEARAYLASKKAPSDRFAGPQPLPGAAHIEHFSIDTEIDRQRLQLAYHVVRLADRGATIAARLLPTEQEVLAREVERLARSLQLMKR